MFQNKKRLEYFAVETNDRNSNAKASRPFVASIYLYFDVLGIELIGKQTHLE
jgi:hypothetical protein